tara:strand:- start:13447 stop:14211 length:765 start_codon:yes stop_codon:yes gene_type:complete
MSTISHFSQSLQESFHDRSLLKVISGLTNFDALSVKKIAISAALGGADLLDIACDPELVHLIRQHTDCPICVSSIEPELFLGAVEAGASVVEIGNFDSFYAQGRVFTAAEVIDMTKRAKSLVPTTPLSVTVPHILPLDEQSSLAVDLINAGADIIQTEGGKSATPTSSGVLGLIQKAAPTLAAVHAISQSFKQADLRAPILCASGLSSVTAPMAIAAGASGIGVGSIVNRLDNELAMVAEVKTIKESLGSKIRV